MSVLRWTDELHQAWKNKRAAQLAAEREAQLNTPKGASACGSRVASHGGSTCGIQVDSEAGCAALDPVAVPHMRGGASITPAVSAKVPGGGESPLPPGQSTDQRASPDATHSRMGAYRSGASAARAPLYEIVHLCRAHRLPEPVPEYQFHPTRKWRFDYAWPLHMLALEVEGGIWTQGRHTRGAGALADMEKYSEAAILGWRLLYVTPGQARGPAIEMIRRAVA